MGRGLALRWAGALVVGGAVACQVLAGIDDRTVADASLDDGGDGGLQPDGYDPCSSPNLPSAPDQSTSSSTDAVTFTAALSQVMLGNSDGGPYYGFNLDSKCTCPGPDSCHSTSPDGGLDCDDPGSNGIDNYARRVFEQVNDVAKFVIDGGLITEAKFNQALQSGISGVLIRVTSYNGQPNDAHVRVTVYASQGFAGLPAAPAFDGGDYWTIDPSSASGQFNTDDAWVTDGTLVATNLNFPIVVGSAITQPVTIQLNDGIITAKLSLDASSNLVSMSGTLGGRWDPAKFLPSLQGVPDPLNNGQYLCGDSGTYQLLKLYICQNRDINQSLSGDISGSCNAVSMGLDFVALPAHLGDAGASIVGPQPCGATWSDDCP